MLTRAAARLAFGAALAMIAGEASAAAVCGTAPGPNDWIECEIAAGTTSATGIVIDQRNVAISTDADERHGVSADNLGVGDIRIELNGGSIATTGDWSSGIRASGPDSVAGPGVNHRGAIAIDVTGVDISTSGDWNAYGIWARQENATDGGRIDIDVRDGSITTRGMERTPYGIHAVQWSQSSDPNANIDWTLDIDVNNVIIKTKDDGIYGRHISASGNLLIGVKRGSIATTDRGGHAILAVKQSGDGNIDIRVSEGAALSTTGEGANAIRAWQGRTFGVFTHGLGEISVDLDDVRAETTGRGAHAVLGYAAAAPNDERIFVRVAGADSRISAAGADSHGVYALHAGVGDVVVEIVDGTLISRRGAGVRALLAAGAGNTAGRIEVDQGGTIEARTGVLAEARAAITVSQARAADDQPMIDIEWTGTFSHGTTATVAPDDNGRFPRATPEGVLDAAREAEAGEALRRYGAPAGIEAEVLHWRHVATVVAASDDPGAIADATAQTAMLDLASTDPAVKARAEAIVARFRSALEHEEIAVADTLIMAVGGTAATAVADLTDTNIVTYLSMDDAATRALLRSVLAESLSEKEMAVLRAVAVNVGLDAALDDTDAAFSTTYKNAVRGLLERRNPGDIRIDMRAGSIVSRGDGVRAYYATPHANNGAISIAIAAGATVTGAAAGVWVANAGREGAGAERIAKQTVIVDGEVTGGADAAAHLVGGGRLTVGSSGKALAGSSGQAIVAEGPGRAEAVIDGEVRGGAGAPAAVHLTGGGRVTVGTTGMVIAGGATSAIRGDKPDDDTPATVVELRLEGAVHREKADAALKKRLDGTIVGDGVDSASGFVFAATGEDGEPTGVTVSAPLVDGRPVTIDLGPEFDCGAAPNPCDGIVIDASRDFGVHARYASADDGNGAIDIAIAAGVTAVGQRAGVHVANAGLTALGKDTPWGRRLSLAADAADLRQQFVAVRGEVRGGLGAAVHLSGGGALWVGEGGRIIASPEQAAVLADAPGRAEVVIDGEVRGAEGAAAAVHLTGGGRVAIGTTGMVIAGGATSAIRGDKPDADTPATVVELRVEGAVHREKADAALRRVDGAITGDGVDPESDFVFAATGEDGAPTGATAPAPLRNGRPDTAGLGPEFDCGATAGRCLGIEIDASRDFGVHARYASPGDGNGAIDIAIARGATVAGVRAGVHVANAGLATLGKDTLWGGRLYLAADAANLRRQFVAVHGEVRGGLDAAVHLSGGGALWVSEGGRVIAPRGHAAVLVNDPGEALLRIDGEVRGAPGAAAAVHLTGGGSVTIGTTGRVIAGGADAAILGDRPTPDTPATEVFLHVDGATPWSAERAGEEAARVDGAIAGDGVNRESGFVFVETDEDGPTGRTGSVRIDENGNLVGIGEVELKDRQDPGRDPDPDPGPQPIVTPGPDRQPVAPRPEPVKLDEFRCDMASDKRCGLYEALPRALLAMNALPASHERMAAARGEAGGWALIEADRRDWKANRSTRPDVAWDLARAGVRAGAEAAVTENLRAGVSAHGRKGSVKMAGGGEMRLSALGLGVNATAIAGGVHIDARAAATRFDVELTSRTGMVLKDGARGMGYALALEAGVPAALDDSLTLTPRAGLSWSRVSLDGFADSRLETPVSVEKAASLAAAAGLSVAMTPGGAGGPRLFASADAIHEFREETEAKVDGVALRASAKPGSVRLGVGASHVWGAGRYAARASANYAAGGAGEGFGGGLNLSLRF